MKRIIFFLLFPLLHASAQDLTGIWRGTFYSSPYEVLYGSSNKYEVQIDNSGRALKGVTYSYQNTTFYGKATLIGMWTPGTKNLIFKEEKLLEYKMASGNENNVSMFTCYLEYRKEGDKEILEGNFTSQGYKDKKEGDNGKIYLERVITSNFKKEDFIVKKEKADSIKKAAAQKPLKNTIAKQNVLPKPKTTTKPATKPPVKQPAKPSVATTTKPTTKPNTTSKTQTSKPTNPLASATPPVTQKPVTPEIVKSEPPKKIEAPTELPQVLKERKNDLVRTITTSANEITINLYDNGEIDGDTISVYLNGRQIAANKGLSTKPITLKIKMDEANADQEVTMVAENLGSIPPNTALMIVNAGTQRYDLRISSSNQNNAVVRFRYAPATTAVNK